MIEFKKISDWAIDLSLHIPLPSFSISVSRREKEKIENAPLKFNQKAEAVIDNESEPESKSSK